MNFKKMIFSSLLLGASLCVAAQEQKTETVDAFKPHWYLQAQVGGQYTLGEGSFGDLVSPNAQLSAGYNFTSIFGVRAGLNAWQSKGSWSDPSYDWKWNYINPNVDLTVNLSNLFCEYKADRKVNVNWFVGLGANIAFGNDEAADVNTALAGTTSYAENLSLLWDGTKTRFQGRTGLMADYSINERWSLGLELQANLINDDYNSKSADNSDWFFNGLVGVKYNLGKTSQKKEVVVPAAPERVIERVIERVVEKPAPVQQQVVAQAVEPLRRDVFFTISSTTITAAEMQKVKDIADYLNKYPNATVEITGYADKGTGNATINKNLSAKRARVVVDALTKNYGVSASRIKSDSKGDTEQPFQEAILNRVSICIAK